MIVYHTYCMKNHKDKMLQISVNIYHSLQNKKSDIFQNTSLISFINM